VPPVPEPLTIARVFTAWQLEPVALLVVAVLVIGYFRAVRRLSEPWPVSRTLALLAAAATHLLVTQSFIGVYAHTLFWVRAVAVITTLMITPLLFALSAPLTLLLRTTPAQVAERLRLVGHSATARVLTFPLLVTAVLALPLVLLYFTPLYGWTLRHPAADELLLLIIAGCGFVYFWTRLGVDPTPREDPHVVSFAISLVEAIVDGAIGLVVWFGPLIAADHYQALHRAWGPDLRLDQIIGAGVLWIGGDLAGLPFVVALMMRWRRAAKQEADSIDAELDAQETRQPAAAQSSASGLWWENDPVLRERFDRHG
jgi:cytochrome c oxidase assembly factor CtaG